MLSKNNVLPSFYGQLKRAKASGVKQLAILLDPEKVDLGNLGLLVSRIHESPATMLFLGGSSVQASPLDALIQLLKLRTGLPIVLFPGHPSQVSPKADALLYLSLLSGRNPDLLIGHHVASAHAVKASGLERVPTGYILCGDDDTTSVSRMSQTRPIPFEQVDTIVATAMAAEMLGKKLVYLEAGSGAREAIPSHIIGHVSENIDIPLIVGGGIRSQSGIQAAYEAGADLVVIGTAFENDPDFFLHV